MRGLPSGVLHAALLAVLGGLAFALYRLSRRWWERYAAQREEIYQPAILMAIANEAFRTLGSPFSDARRAGDWLIVEGLVLKWAKGQRGFAQSAFSQIYEQNGFAEYRRAKLGSLRASERVEAARRLGLMLYMKAVPDLLTALRDRSPEVRRTASWALANMGQSDSASKVVTTAQPLAEQGSARRKGGSVTGRFYWEDGDRIHVSTDQETAYLMRRAGGMSGGVRNKPRTTRDGRVLDDAVGESYYSEYRLNWIDSRFPASIRAVLKQPVEDYYVVTYRDRDNVVLSEGCLTENIDFVFPRYGGPDDRLSVKGRLIVPSGGARPRGKTPEACVSLRGEGSPFCSEYRSFTARTSYRLHDVPPGKYHLRADCGEFFYEGSIEVSQTQPMVLDLTLK